MYRSCFLEGRIYAPPATVGLYENPHYRRSQSHLPLPIIRQIYSMNLLTVMRSKSHLATSEIVRFTQLGEVPAAAGHHLA